MQSVSTSIASYLAALDPEKARLLRNARNNERYAEAVRRVFATNPDAGEYVLAHTNSLYIEKDARPRKRAGETGKRLVINVYLDDAMARAELNARRELVLFALKQLDMHLDEMVIRNATWGMKERHLFPKVIERMRRRLAGEDDAPDQTAPMEAAAQQADERRGAVFALRDRARLLETLKRAFCLAFGDLDRTEAILEKVEGAVLDEAAFGKRAKRGKTRYWCHLYASDREALESMLGDRERKTVISRAKDLGLVIGAIQLHQSPSHLQGRQAFPRNARPLPLTDLDLEKMRETDPV